MISAFNSLKGLLALMIFIHHLGLYNGGGSLAVTIFFILSGFLSAIGYNKRVFSNDFSYKDYLVGKCIKFYPMHWLLLITAIPFMLLDSSMSITKIGLIGVNAMLIHSFIPIQSVYFSGNAVSWYLSDTLAFVAVFPFVLRWMILANKKMKLIVILVICIIYVLFWIFLPQDYTHSFFYISPMFRFIDYMTGIAVALCYLKLKDKQHIKEFVSNHLMLLNSLACVCFAFLVAISFANEKLVLHSIIYMPCVCVMLIIIALTGGGYLRVSILQKFGAISFAFFLVHYMCIRYLHLILGKIGLDEIFFVATLAFIITTIVSYFLTYKFDKIISLWLKNKLLNQQSMTVQ